MRDKKIDEKGLARLLAESGLVLDHAAWARMIAYLHLIQRWNKIAKLVSTADAQDRLMEHLADSLSLAPYVLQTGETDVSVLDIGSGGGFPAIPLKILLPGVPFVLVERSVKKIGFLRKVVGALSLPKVEFRHGSFPEAAEGVFPGRITARAVGKPHSLLEGLAARIQEGGTFLCQAPELIEALGEMFHVERVEDAWSAAGLRRGEFHQVTAR